MIGWFTSHAGYVVAYFAVVAYGLMLGAARSMPAPQLPERMDALSYGSAGRAVDTQAAGGLDCARRPRLTQVERRPGTVDPGTP